MDTQQRILHRLKIIRGQVDQVIEMLEKHKYCIDVLHQSRAVQHALKEVDYLVLERHLQTCVVDLVKEGKADESIEEIMLLFKNGGK